MPSSIAAMTAQQRVDALRALLAEHHLDAYIVPSEDAHMSEYVATCDERRAFLTSFTGSAGTALVTSTAGYCWTDGRYFVQAIKQLDPAVFEMKRLHEEPPIDDWLAANMPDLSVIGIDGSTISINAMKKLRATAASAEGKSISILSLPPEVPNLVDEVWGSARPAKPAAPIHVHPVKYAGVSVAHKLSAVRAKMTEKGVTMFIATALDDVAWLLNMRGSDVDYNPVFWSYVIVTLTTTTLYVNNSRFADGVEEHLAENVISVAQYEAMLGDLSAYCWDDSSKVWLDANSCNFAILDCIEKSCPGIKVLLSQGPITLSKAAKCDVELDGMRACHVRDGAALSKFLCWLERTVVVDGKEVDELDASDKLDGLRSEVSLYKSLSFPTISGADSNGAVVHYRAEKKTCGKITKDSMYLVDSGGQYCDGTTDVTRTVHMAKPTEWQRECFTRVLKGHIAIDSAVFPKGTTGHMLDSFARQALWSIGLDYKHGTGHGVGSFLNVHEGPHVISFKAQAQTTALQPNFITSNEPGYYETDNFGIRIENLCIVAEANVQGPPGGVEKPFYTMEHITFCPIQTKLIDVRLLTQAEREWVDNYHEECYAKLSPLLQDDPLTLSWLRKNTAKLVEE